MNTPATFTVEKVVPFRFLENDMLSLFSKWLQDSTFAPTNVASEIETSEFVAISAPIYECNCDYTSYWHGEYSTEHTEIVKDNLGHLTASLFTNSYYDGSNWRNPADERLHLKEKKVKDWHKHQGTYMSNQTHVIPSSDMWANGVYESLSPFDLEKAVALSTSVVGNATKLSITFDDNRVWELAWPSIWKQASQELTKRRITERVVDLKVQYTKQETTIIFLPIWSWQFVYDGKQFSALMNGQTGKIIGQKPSDPVKQWRLVFFIALILFILSLCFVASMVITAIMQR